MKTARKLGGVRLDDSAALLRDAATAAFTMIEIAISLAVIGFALVAIIGILPTGMNVQKDNREETIINHDESILMDAIRNGERGVDDLTNYVMAITNTVTQYASPGSAGQFLFNLGYTYSDSSTTPKFPITNGLRIVGLLSTPKFIPNPATKNPDAYLSNYVVAYIRSMSGGAGEKFPQTNPIVQDLALSYRMIPEIVPYCAKTNNTGPGMYDPNWTNWTAPELYVAPTNFAEINARSNFWMIARTLHTNMCDVRLIFRWPLFANGTAGNRRQVFRATLGGHLLYTTDPFVTQIPLYFFEPRTYVKAATPVP